jgi:hypothetical protein
VRCRRADIKSKSSKGGFFEENELATISGPFMAITRSREEHAGLGFDIEPDH